MTWSPNVPRAVHRKEGSSSPAPVSWAPEELALDTRGLLEALERATEERGDAVLPPDGSAAAAAIEGAYSQGYEEGRRAGEIGEAARLRTAVTAVSEALASLQDQSAKWVVNAEENVCALAVAVARHIIGKEIAVDRSSLNDVVLRALGEFPVDQAVVVRLNPLDLHAVSSTMGGSAEPGPLGTRKDIQWFSDARVAPGGCIIEGRDRIVDGRVDIALERIYRRLTDTGA